MRATFILSLFLLLTACAINDKPNYNGLTMKSMGHKRCGLPDDLVRRVIVKYDRGPVDGAFDENNDGFLDIDEAFTNWDFSQTMLVLMQGVDEKTIRWTNIDTCFQFHITPHQFYEDMKQKPVWRTCRSFTYTVYTNKQELIGTHHGRACRNIATHDWSFF